MLKQREIRRSMTVMVNKEYVGKEAECVLDGSGVGTKGNGIYIELIWPLNERNFIKQHVPLDVQTQKVVSFFITSEAHGDAKVMPATTRGTLKMDVGLTRILADGAYDTVSNWVLTEEIDMDVASKRLNSAILLLRVYFSPVILHFHLTYMYYLRFLFLDGIITEISLQIPYLKIVIYPNLYLYAWSVRYIPSC